VSRGSGVFLRILAVLVVAGGAVASWLFFGGGETASEESPPVPVRTKIPIREDVEEILRVYGNLKSANQVTVLPKVSGAVTAIEAGVGDPVEEGDLLAEIDREAYRLEKGRADAALAATSSTWFRIDRLYGSGSATRQEWEEARAAYLSAEAQAAGAALRYGWTRVLSPADGVILMKHAAVGSLVSPEAGTPLFTIGSLEDLQVELSVPEENLAAFEGRFPDVRMMPEAFGGIQIDAEIVSVAPWVDPVTRTFAVTCRVSSGEDKAVALRPGMLMAADFVLSLRRDVLTLPVSALTSGKGLWEADEGGRARFIELDRPTVVGSRVLIPDSLEGRRFVTEGQHFLVDGAEVRILESPGGDPGQTESRP
jgi:membrane fusion protein, multidrug efflux system